MFSMWTTSGLGNSMLGSSSPSPRRRAIPGDRRGVLFCQAALPADFQLHFIQVKRCRIVVAVVARSDEETDILSRVGA